MSQEEEVARSRNKVDRCGEWCYPVTLKMGTAMRARTSATASTHDVDKPKIQSHTLLKLYYYIRDNTHMIEDSHFRENTLAA
jgi:hypothetical protein